MFACLVQTVYEDGFGVVFLEKLHKPNLFILKQDDHAFVFVDEVEGRLREPQLSKRGGRENLFDTNCSQWNMQLSMEFSNFVYCITKYVFCIL